MANTRPAPGGGKWVEVAPDRLARWLAGFTERHGAHDTTAAGDRWLLAAADGAVAQLYPPPGAAPTVTLAEFVAEAQRPRRIGLLLARKAAAAIGVADGAELVSSKVDSWYVQGRTAAGGQSQQRFARRRGNQATAAAGKAADLVASRLLPATPRLSALVTGGDKGTVATILADPRLSALAALRAERHIAVPTPNLAVLKNTVSAARAVAIHLVEPDLGR